MPIKVSCAAQEWLDPRLATLNPSDLLFAGTQPSSAGWGSGPCAPPSAFAAVSASQPLCMLQPGSYTFGPLSTAPPHSQADPVSLQGLGSAGLVDANAMQALTGELLDEARGFGGNMRTAHGWPVRGAGQGSAAGALRALMPPPATPMPGAVPAVTVPQDLARGLGSTSTVSTACWGPAAAAGWLERQCASEGSAPKRDLHHTRSNTGELLQRTSAAS